MADRSKRTYEIYDADADGDFADNSRIADYSVIERQMVASHGSDAQYQPTLPSGRVIDYKNTMQSYDVPNDGSTATPPTSHTTNNVGYRPSSTNVAIGPSTGSNSNTEDIQAVAIVEGKLFAETPESPRRYRTIWFVSGALAIVIAVIVTGVCASGNCSAKSDPQVMGIPSLSPTMLKNRSPTLTPHEAQIENTVTLFINDITYSGEAIWMNGTSPESRALTWLIKEDTLFSTNRSALLNLDIRTETVESFRVRQRFSLRTLWYQQFKEDGRTYNWVNTLGWTEYSDECEWYGINCTSYDFKGTIGVQKVVTRVDFFSLSADTNNDFFGTIPPDIGLLTSLTILDFRSNRVTGSLPDSIVYCSRINAFLFGSGFLVGTLPSMIGQFTDLMEFDVSDNGLSGTLPSSASKWSNLTFFKASDNRIGGTIPDFIGQWTMLEVLDFSDNLLSRTIPESIGQLTKLEYLNLGQNNLIGTLPSSIGALVNISTAAFFGNEFKGMIPESVGNWSQIEVAGFSSNFFSGTIPSQICFGTKNSTIYIDCAITKCPCCIYEKECTKK